MAPSNQTQPIKPTRNGRSRSLSQTPRKRSVSMKHKQPSVATALLGNLASDKQTSPIDKTPGKTNSVPTGQSPTGKTATSKTISPLKQSHATATDNLNLGSARGGNDLSLFSPILSRKQKRSQNS